MQPSRRRKKRTPLSPSGPGVRNVELVKGRQGYGFTLSGQAPCLLSCVTPNTPAARAGLKPGDCLIAVNGHNVSKASHDEVVHLIGASKCPLRLSITEPPDSDSSDTEENLDLLTKPRTKYPHRPRKSVPRIPRQDRSPDDFYKEEEWEGKRPNITYRVLTNQEAVRNMSIPPEPRPRPPIPPAPHPLRQLRQSPRKFKDSQYSEPMFDDDQYSLPVSCLPVFRRSEGPQSLPIGQKRHILDQDSDSDGSERENEEMILRAVVGYLGTIEMPESPGRGIASRLQAIRSCVRRLRIEKKVHTLVLLGVTDKKVLLTGPAGLKLASFPSNRITFCGVYADDARFFGLVTRAPDDQPRLKGEIITGPSSCHVFMVDARLSPHSAHAGRARNFRLVCTPLLGGCVEFPTSAEPILGALVSLCRTDPGSVYFGPLGPLNEQENREGGVSVSPPPSQRGGSGLSTTSSNSDSGIGFRDSSHEGPWAVPPMIPLGQPNPIVYVANQDPPPLVFPPQQIPLTPPREDIPLAPTENRPGPSSMDKLAVRVMGDKDVQSPGEIEHAAKLRSSLNRMIGIQGLKGVRRVEPEEFQLAINKVSSNNVSVDDKLSPQVYRSFALEHKLGKPMEQNKARTPSRTPSERSKARSLEDLREKPDQKAARALFPRETSGSDNRLDKLADSFTWHWVAGVTRCLLEEDMPHQFSKEYLAVEGTETFADCASYNITPTTDVKDNDDLTLSSIRIPNRPGSLRRIGQGRKTGKSPEGFEDDGKTVRCANTMETDDVLLVTKEAGCSYSKGRVAVWTQSFEKLLEDTAGLHTFAEFLKKEFSHENIYFWAACERYRSLFATSTASQQRTRQARLIYDKHLAPGATDPVNIDGPARQQAQDGLDRPTVDLFAQAQKQVYNLMKFDCYPRFLKSALFREVMQADECGKPIPFPGDSSMDTDLRLQFSTEEDENRNSHDHKAELKKSDSDAGERRRRSLIHWVKRDRSRAKSRERSESESRRKNKDRLLKTKQTEEDGVSIRSDLTGSQVSLPTCVPKDDKVATSRESLVIPSGKFQKGTIAEGEQQDECKLCRIRLPDDSTTVVPLQSGESVRNIVSKLLERRGLKYTAFDVHVLETGAMVDVTYDSSVLGCKEVRVEQRSLVHVDLPGGKNISIKAKPERILSDLLKSVLHKYGLKLDLVTIARISNKELVNMKLPVSSLDGQRIYVQTKDLTKVSDLGGTLKMTRRSPALDEITNKVFEELLKGKSEEPSFIDFECASNKGCRPNERRLAFIPHLDGVLKSHSQQSLKDLMPPPGTRPPQKKQGRDHETALYEGLKRAQRSRLEDQRGTEINSELPDFLRKKTSNEFPLDGRASEPIFGSRREVISAPRLSSALAVPSVQPLHDTSDFQEFTSQGIDRSFSTDGLLPNHSEAERYFGGSTGVMKFFSPKQEARQRKAQSSDNLTPRKGSDKMSLSNSKENIGNKVQSMLLQYKKVLDKNIKSQDESFKVGPSRAPEVFKPLEKRYKSPVRTGVKNASLYHDLDLDLDVTQSLRGRAEQVPLPTPPRPVITPLKVETPNYPPPTPLHDLYLDDPLAAAHRHTPKNSVHTLFYNPPPLPPKPKNGSQKIKPPQRPLSCSVLNQSNQEILFTPTSKTPVPSCSTGTKKLLSPNAHLQLNKMKSDLGMYSDGVQSNISFV
ncbi:regulator of G-protein signaling loco-like isoform X2 [Artemia franciscana]|uniref:Regulator of G-protein signaling loco-like n=1 Tax=Artemia franciscana TaxID=6661 RepID=A0AA88HEX4_ARTSF|nr:hypothetical protein QYM36_016292 [Artemia franciscana]